MYSIITIAYIYHKKVFYFSSVLFISLHFILMYIARRMCVINKNDVFIELESLTMYSIHVYTHL